MKYRKNQLTDWFPPYIKPVRVGVYSTDWGYAHWNGKRWGCGQDTPWLARKCPDYRKAFQRKSWCGLNFNPAKKGGAA